MVSPRPGGLAGASPKLFFFKIPALPVVEISALEKLLLPSCEDPDDHGKTLKYDFVEVSLRATLMLHLSLNTVASPPCRMLNIHITAV